MRDLYHQGNRHLQDQFGTRQLPDRIQERVVSETIRQAASPPPAEA